MLLDTCSKEVESACSAASLSATQLVQAAPRSFIDGPSNKPPKPIAASFIPPAICAMLAGCCSAAARLSANSLRTASFILFLMSAGEGPAVS